MKAKHIQSAIQSQLSSPSHNSPTLFLKQRRIKHFAQKEEISTIRISAANQLLERQKSYSHLEDLNFSTFCENQRKLNNMESFFLFLIIKIKILLQEYQNAKRSCNYRIKIYHHNIFCFSSLLRVAMLSILMFSANGSVPQCADGQVWDPVNNFCAVCLDSNCKVCAAPLSVNVCQTCDAGYVLSSFTCQLCSAPFCQTCVADMSGSVVCATCVAGYTLGSADCQLCSDLVAHCADCTSPTNCLSCQPGFVKGATCDPCQDYLAGCTQCSDASTCTECNAVGYFLEPGQTSCSLCSSRLSLIFCTECEHTGLYCITCDTNYMLGGILHDTCYQCGMVVGNCATCDTNACTGCNPGFMLMGGDCLPCSTLTPNCSTCTSTVCNTCLNQFFLNSTICSSCATAITNCTVCSNSLICNSCILDNIVVVSGSSAICMHCSLVIQGCISCKANNQCDDCDYASGYFLNSSGVCDHCSPTLLFCAYCINSTTCTICISNQYGINSLSQCQSCQTLATGCLTCLNSTYCTSCTSNSFYLNLSDSSCHTCISYLPQCLQCFHSGSSMKCSKCNMGFHLNYKTECVCDIGTLIDGYCVDVVGCVHASFGPVCTACQSGMILIHDKCECSADYWLVSGHCTNVTGCIAVRQATPINICLFCDIQQHFILGNDSQCYCSQYYKREGNSCLQVCGDGVAIKAECDDGNLVDGDGCSSSCRAEAGYTCSKATQVSKCIFTSKFTITLVKIQKIQNANSGRFVFEFSPNANALSAMNYSKYLSLSIPQSNFTISSIIYNNGYLNIDFDYSSDLSGLTATLTLDFDPAFFSVDSYTYSFQIVSDGLQLKYLVKLQFCKILQYVFMGLGLLSLAIFFVSLPLHKMLGVETLQNFQVFFMTALIIDNYEQPLNVLTYLKYTMGMVDIWAYNASVALNTKLLYNRLGVLRQFIQNQILVCPLSALLAIIFLSYFLKYLFQQHKQEEQINIFQKKLISVFSCLYKRLLFPIIIGFSFGSFVALYSQTSTYKQWKNPNIKDQEYIPERANFIFLLMFCLIYSFVFWAETLIPKISCVTKVLLNVQKAKSWYVSQYLAYSFLLLSFFMGGYQISLKVSLNMMFIIIFLHFCFISAGKPYKERIHMAGIIVNQSTLFILCLSLIVRYLKIENGQIYNQQDNIIMVLLFAFLLALVNVMAVIRIVYVVYLKLGNPSTIKKVGEENSFQQRMLQTYRQQTRQEMQRNKYFLENQIISKRLSQWRENQSMRIQHGVEQLQFSKIKFHRRLPLKYLEK